MSGIFTNKAFNLVKEDLATIADIGRPPQNPPLMTEDHPRRLRLEEAIERRREEIRAMTLEEHNQFMEGVDLRAEIRQYSNRLLQEKLDERVSKPGDYPFDRESFGVRRTEYLDAWMRWLSGERLSPEDERYVSEIHKSLRGELSPYLCRTHNGKCTIADLEAYKALKQGSERWGVIIEKSTRMFADLYKDKDKRWESWRGLAGPLESIGQSQEAACPALKFEMNKSWLDIGREESDRMKYQKRKAHAVEDEPDDYLLERQKTNDIEKILGMLSVSDEQPSVGLEGSIWAPCRFESK